MSAVVEEEKDRELSNTNGINTNTQLRSLLSRFATKVLDRDPTLTRDKATAVFKQALAESGSSSNSSNNKNGSGGIKGDKIGSGDGTDDDNDKLLMQIPEMIDVIQTDFLFALSVSVCMKANIKREG